MTRLSPFLENVVIITGASCGIGRELALQLADQGAWLTLTARSADKLEEVADRCRQRGGKALVVPTDVSDRRQCARLIEQTVAGYSRIDTLINNAGIGMRARLDEIPDLDLLEQLIRVNYLGRSAWTLKMTGSESRRTAPAAWVSIPCRNGRRNWAALALLR